MYGARLASVAVHKYILVHPCVLGSHSSMQLTLFADNHIPRQILVSVHSIYFSLYTFELATNLVSGKYIYI